MAIQEMSTKRGASAVSSLSLPRPNTVRRKVDPLHDMQLDAIRVERDLKAVRPHVIGEAFFKSVLVREFRRAERSNLPAAVVLVSDQTAQDAQCHGSSCAAWRPIIAALNAAKRETDVIGWFSQGSTIAVVFPEIRGAVAEMAGEFELRLRRELGRRLEAAATRRLVIEFHVGPGAKDDETTDRQIELLPLELRTRPRHAAAYNAGKRALDIVGSLLLLAFLSPVLLALAVLTKLTSRGPVFFRQPRIGQMGKPFTMLKFRTMYLNSDAALHQKFVTDFIKSSAKSATTNAEAPFKIKNDPRVTPLGRIMRKTSLDELPQFINVLFGEMSLVGPRPPIAYEVEQYQLWHSRRLFEAKPGVTGLWQVTGRSRTTFDEMVRLDLRYARSYSLWTDLKILLATPGAVITGKGAC